MRGETGVAGRCLFRVITIAVGLAVAGAWTARAEPEPGAVLARSGMVVCDSPAAAEVGRDLLRSGGNAVDAAVGTALAMAVTFPPAGNVGGGGFLVYYGVADGAENRTARATTFDFREVAPQAASERLFVGDDGGVRGDTNHEGLLSVGVPGTLSGLHLAHLRLGRLPWAAVVAPAVRLAEKGFPLPPGLAHSRNVTHAARLKKHPATAALFFKPDGSAYAAGEVWRQPDLAAVLRRVQEDGCEGFYRGETARRLAAFMAEGGGLITEGDLARYRAVERAPVHGTYRGYDIYAMAPPSSGGVALVEMLNILEGYDLRASGHNSARTLHLLTEAMRRAFADRARHLGDPDLNPGMPVARLVSKEHAARLRATIDPERATPSDLDQAVGAGVGFGGGDTTHLSVVDAAGNAVSLTYTLEQTYGSGIVASGLGFLLNNEMGDFNPVPGATTETGQIGTPPNLVAPGKRMLSSMTPTIVARDGKVVLVLGSPGGRTIINTVLQVVLNTVDHRMALAEAVAAPRIHHQWFPDQTRFERGRFSDETIRRYQAMGHAVRIAGGQGRAMCIALDPGHPDGPLRGVADPRSPDGTAVGY